MGLIKNIMRQKTKKISNGVKKEKSFTIIELLVVISVIGLLAGIVWIGLSGIISKARITKAQAEVETIFKAILMLRTDTGKYPRVNDINSIDGFKNYVAPYLSDVGNDPWGKSYFYDGCPEPCESCVGPDWNAGCELGVWQTSICSGGPDGIIQSQNVPGPVGDDICLYFK